MAETLGLTRRGFFISGGKPLKRDPFEPRLRTLRQLYSEVTKEPLLERFKELLERLK